MSKQINRNGPKKPKRPGKPRKDRPKTQFSKRLWDIYADYTYTQISEIFGVSWQTCQRYMTGKMVPDVEVLRRIILDKGRDPLFAHWLITGEKKEGTFGHTEITDRPLPLFMDENRENVFAGVPREKLISLLEPEKVGEASKFGVNSSLDWGPKELEVGMVEIIDDGTRVIIDRTLLPVQGKPAIFEKEEKLYIAIYEKEEEGIRAYRVIATLI